MVKTAIVSGGSRGLGAEIVRDLLAETSLQVATMSRTRTDKIDTFEAKFGDRLLYSSTDLANRDDVRRFVDDVVEHFGSIDILVNNASVAFDGLLALQGLEEVDMMVDVNLKGTHALTKFCTREMLTTGWGRIVNVTSIVAQTGFRGLTGYGLTKSGIEGLTKSLGRELGSRGITVNSVAPGFLDTAMTDSLDEDQRDQIRRRTPVGRLGVAEDVAPVVRFLVGEEAGFINGETIVVDGGMTA